MDTLKTKLTSDSNLAYPRDSGSFILDCAACDFGIGDVLSEIQDGVEKVIAYGSQTLSKAEGRYCATRKELLSIVYFVEHYKHYWLGRHFLVRTDHQPLKWLFSLQEPTGQLARWLEFLQSFNFEYRPGSMHVNANGMSRTPCHPQECQCHFSIDDLPCGLCSECQRISSYDLVKISAITTRQSGLDRPPDPVPWTGLYTSVQLRDFQLQDKQIAIVLLWKELSERPPSSQLVLSDPETRYLWLSWYSLEIKEGVLYKQAILQPQRHSLQYIVPKHLRDEVLHSCHNMVLSGRLGEKKTHKNHLRFATWFRLMESIHTWIEKCDTCHANKRPKKHERDPMGSTQVGATLDRITTDLVGPHYTHSTQRKLSYSGRPRFIYQMGGALSSSWFSSRNLCSGYVQLIYFEIWYSFVLTLRSRKELWIRSFSRTLQNVRNPENPNHSFPPLWKQNGGKKQFYHAFNNPFLPKRSSAELGWTPWKPSWSISFHTPWFHRVQSQYVDAW